MRTPTRTKLIEELRKLSAGARVRRLGEIGRGRDGGLDALIAELWRGDALERAPALRLASASGRPTVIRELQPDPAASVRLPAAVEYARTGDSSTIRIALLDTLAEDARACLLRDLGRGRRDIADQLVDALVGVRPRGGPELRRGFREAMRSVRPAVAREDER